MFRCWLSVSAGRMIISFYSLIEQHVGRVCLQMIWGIVLKYWKARKKFTQGDSWTKFTVWLGRIWLLGEALWPAKLQGEKGLNLTSLSHFIRFYVLIYTKREARFIWWEAEKWCVNIDIEVSMSMCANLMRRPGQILEFGNDWGKCMRFM